MRLLQLFLVINALVSGAHSHSPNFSKRQVEVPSPPEPEPVVVTRVPLPPVAPSDDEGACSKEINPNSTGCVSKTCDLHSGNFLPDNNHVVAIANFTGAPPAPDPANIYSGQHAVLLKVDGTVFPSGDSWKCVTCGLPDENAQGRTSQWDYPQSFRDGKRILVGTHIVECEEGLASSGCTSQNTHIYPLRWNVNINGTGEGGAMREQRIHPDNVHIGFNSFTYNAGKLDQYSYFGRLVFNPEPTVGEPLVPRYDVVNVTVLHNPDNYPPIIVDPDDSSKIIIKDNVPSVGESRGFGGTGKEVTYIGFPAESSNIDVFAADLQTGDVRRLTAHPEYVDPVDVSPDDQWHVIMDTRGTDRQMFLSVLRGIPPLTDLVSTSAVSSTRNNGQRRFFLPWLLDHDGDRGNYFGQQLNAEGSGIAGSGDINDPEWNGRADPKWSWDMTRIAYTQIQTLPPACGGDNPLPCYPSKEDGGRTERIMIAHLTDRKPRELSQVDPVPDEVPWGMPFPPGSPPPSRPFPGPGNYTLDGQAAGYANVSFVADEEGASLVTVSAEYHDFSDDGLNFLNGAESVTRQNEGPTLELIHWFSNLTQTGPNNGTKKTSPDGFHLRIDVMTNIFEANGTLTTTVDGTEYHHPANGT